MSESNNSLSIISDIFTSPNKAFEDIKVNYPIMLPLFTVLILNAAMVILLFMSLDYQWYVDELVQRATTAESTQEEIAAMRNAFGAMSATTTGLIGGIFGAIFLALMYAVMALYFVMMSAINNDGYKFKQWMSFISWTSLPSIIGTLASFVVILSSSNGQIAPESINPLSLNELFFGLDATKGIGSMLAGTGITTLWTFALMVIGYSKWTNKSMAMSAIVITCLYSFAYGIWFLMI